MTSITRGTGHLAGMVLLITVCVVGAERASGAGESVRPTAASVTRIGTKEVRDGSLLYKDFKRGELTKRFPTVSRVETLERTVRTQLVDVTKELRLMAVKWQGASINAQSNEMAIESLTIAHEGLVLDDERFEKRVDALEAGRGAGIQTLMSGRGEVLALPGLLALDGTAGQSPSLHLVSKGPALDAVATTMQGSNAYSAAAGGSVEIPLASGTQMVDLHVVAGRTVLRIHVTLTDLAEGAYRFVASSTATAAT